MATSVTPGRLNALAVDPTRGVLALDSTGQRIYRVSGGLVSVWMGTGTRGNGADLVPVASTIPLNTPAGLTVTGDGHVLVSEYDARALRLVW